VSMTRTNDLIGEHYFEQYNQDGTAKKVAR
jgi:hypothetical protein